MPQMGITVHCRSADIHAGKRRCNRFKEFLAAGKGIIDIKFIIHQFSVYAKVILLGQRLEKAHVKTAPGPFIPEQPSRSAGPQT